MQSVRGDVRAKPLPVARSGATRTLPDPPPALVWVAGLVVLACLFMAAVGSWRTGITWDEPYHVMRLRNWFEYGWFALDWSLSGGPAAEGANTAVYGPVTALLMHSLGMLVGVEGWGEVASTPTAFAVRHFGVFLIGSVGTAATAALGRQLLGSWRWGLVTAATLLALPMWTGHMMFNIKDVSVATGYTMVTLGLVLIVRKESRAPLRIACLVVGAVLMIGTRPGMWTALACGLVIVVVGGRLRSRAFDVRVLREGALGLVVSGVLLVAAYPRLFGQPWLLLQSASQSATFRDGRQAFLGYVPGYVAIQTPLLLLGFFGIGLVGWLVYAGRRQPAEAPVIAITLVLAQLLALPTAGVVMQSDFYNALRQVLFAAPAWAVVTTFGIARILARPPGHIRRRIGQGVAVAAMVLPTVAQMTQFPYQYTWFNPVPDAAGARTESDYWRASVPELFHSIPTDGPIVCSPVRLTVPGSDETVAQRFSHDSSVDCRADPIGPLSSRWAVEGLPMDSSLPYETFYTIIDRDHRVPRNCTLLSQVTRKRVWHSVRMTYVARCQSEPPLLDSEGVDFVWPYKEPRMHPGLWAYAPLGWVVRENRDRLDADWPMAALTFDASATCAEHACEVALVGGFPSDLILEIDGVPVESRTNAEGEVRASVPRGHGRVWLTLKRASGDSLDAHVSTLRLEPSNETTEGMP